MLAGCSGGTATPAPQTSAAPPASAGAPAEQQTVGLVAFDNSSPIDRIFQQSAQASLEKLGYKVLTQDPKGDPGQANAICTQYVTAHVAALAIITFAWDQMATCEAEAKAANIPMFFEGSPLLAGMAGAVDVVSPKPINDLFIKYVLDNHVTNIFTLDYSPGTPCRLRAAYRDQLLKDQAPNVQVTRHQFPIPGQVVDATNATASWLQAHPEGAGTYAIWSCFADPTTGALAALSQANRTIPIFTWDYNKALYQPIKDKKVAADLYLDAVKVGEQHASLVDQWLKGNHQPQGLAGAIEVLTSDNIDAFLQAHPDANK